LRAISVEKKERGGERRGDGQARSRGLPRTSTIFKKKKKKKNTSRTMAQTNLAQVFSRGKGEGRIDAAVLGPLVSFFEEEKKRGEEERGEGRGGSKTR